MKSLAITPYSLLIISGWLAGVLISLRKSRPISRYDGFYCLIMMIVGAMAGGKLFYLAINIKAVIAEFQTAEFAAALKTVLSGGFVLYGGFAGGIAAILLVCRTNSLDPSVTLDFLSPSFAISIGIGRIGCLLAGCCYGRIISETGMRFPTQICESIFCIMLCVFLLLRKRNQFRLFLLLYSVFRFIIEFFRGDSQRGSLWLFSTSQWISLAILIALAATAIAPRKRP